MLWSGMIQLDSVRRGYDHPSQRESWRQATRGGLLELPTAECGCQCL
jgi:hypothetical protein